MYNISASVEKEGSWYVSHCLELQVTSQGKTIEEAIKNLKEAVELYIRHADADELAHLKNAHSRNPIIATISVG